MSCSIILNNIALKRKEKVIQNNISLNVSHKEKIAIIGKNGSGKTTLLETIAGLHFPLQGSLEIFHHQIKSAKDYKEYRHLVGFLCQNSDEQFLAPTVQDDIAFSLLAREIDTKEAFSKTMQIMQELEIYHLKDKIVYNLSGGEKKLVALAGVLVVEPKIMLLDEPTNDLDENIQIKLKSILQKIDKSIIIVTHDKSFTEGIVDKTYILCKEGLFSTI